MKKGIKLADNFQEYEQYDALGLKNLMDQKQVSRSEVIEAAISRAQDRNPAINAIVTPLYEQARATTEESSNGPLSGIPFLIKDLAYVKDVRCSFGSRLWKDFVPDHDGDIVSRYRKAGLVIMGKTNTPEIGLACTTEPVLFGPCKNPWDLTRTSGGSSGGAAAAVSAGILPVAHATDGGGSIRIPASCCGLVGLKPTRGRTPLGPDVGEGWGSMATAHVVSRSVRDSAAFLDATHGPASGDPYGAPHFSGSFLEAMSRNPGRLKIAVDRKAINLSQPDSEVSDALAAAAALCESLGHQVEEKSFEYDRETVGMAANALVLTNVRNNILRRAELIGVSVTTDVIEPYTELLVNLANEMSGETYARAMFTIHAATRQIENFFTEYDLILSPTVLLPPPELGFMNTSSTDFETYSDHFNQFWGYTNLYNATGNPAISLPLAWSQEKLPIGMQLVASMGNESLLFQISRQLEEAAPWFDKMPPISDSH